MSIDEKCLSFDGEVAYVDIQREGETFARKDVKLGLSDGIHVEILEGLEPGDRIKM